MSTPPFSIGNARISLINVGELHFDLDRGLNVPADEVPAHYAELFARPVRVPINCILIEIAGTSILVDAGSVDLADDSPFRIPGYQPPPDLAAQLAGLNVTPATVDHVVITHMHFDHYNGLLNDAGELLFPNATHHIGRADWQGSIFQKAAARTDSLENRVANALNHSERLHLIDGDVDGEYTIIDGITIVPAPGETAGHQAVRVQSGRFAERGDVLYCVGDLYHHPVEVIHPHWMTSWADPESNLASKDRISSAALAQNARLIATHIPGVGRLEKTDSGVRWQMVGA